jgi:hypothetical protein
MIDGCERFKQRAYCLFASIIVVAAGGCSRHSSPGGLRIMPAGKQFSGFLSGYSRLAPNPKFESTLSYVRDDPQRNVHKYVAVIVEPVVVYVASDATIKAMPDRGRTALANYFQQAIVRAVSDAFPVVQEPGPLVLRLRSALVGVDVGPPRDFGHAGAKGAGALERTINIGKVGVEVELVDSETGEQIAAAVDRQNLGEAAVIGSENFTREEKFRAATQAVDGWASRLREFLDAAHELSPEDVSRVERTNYPYSNGEDIREQAKK